MPLKVLLDTSIYRADEQRRSAGFKALTSLCEQGLLSLYIPSIAKREFTTHIAAQAEAAAKEVIKALKTLSRKDGPASSKRKVEAALTELDALPSLYNEHAVATFEKWLKLVKAQVHEVRPDCVEDVLDSYFTGRPPFKSVKERKDFPDAFIWQIVNDIANQIDRLHVVVNDKGLRDAIDQINNVSVYEDLDQFIQTQEVQALFPENFARKYEQEIIEALRWQDDVLRDAVDEAVHTEIEGTKILHTVEDNQDDADIVDIPEITNIEFDFSLVRYFGYGSFQIPFKAELKAHLDYFLMKSTYYSMPESESNQLDIQDSDWNEYFIWVAEGRYLTVDGKLNVEIDVVQIIKDNQGGDHLDEDTIINNCRVTLSSIDSIDIEDRRFSL